MRTVATPHWLTSFRGDDAEQRPPHWCRRVDQGLGGTDGIHLARVEIQQRLNQAALGGRPSVMTPERIVTAERMRAERQSWESIGRVLGVGASRVRRALADPQ
ncbi:hypothetical protein DC31_00025 [Microbacterium sp. CH12i]|uniref:hypothetical protein n=1 Tax=Microbacterium sp. CH12i TaxID=1479651 RepID=UPI000461072E|nr:hypothetical protein [Microbacterium sp. CH12i]KDA07166.1 hypothetical protein DC31_00025 [Microbacterium sp. CH12i]